MDSLGVSSFVACDRVFADRQGQSGLGVHPQAPAAAAFVSGRGALAGEFTDA